MVNLLSVLVAAVAGAAVGFVWYGPLFGKAWMRLSGRTMDEMEAAKKKGMGGTYGLMLLGFVVMAYVLAYTFDFLGVDSYASGATSAFWLWLGFVVAIRGINELFSKTRSFGLFLLDSFHYLAVMLVMTAVLTLWP